MWSFLDVAEVAAAYGCFRIYADMARTREFPGQSTFLVAVYSEYIRRCTRTWQKLS